MRILLVCSEGKDRFDGGGVFLQQLVNALADHQLFSVVLKIGSGVDIRVRPELAGLEIGVRGPVRGLGKLERFHTGLAGQVEWRAIRPMQLRSRLALALPHIADFQADAIFGIITSTESMSALNGIVKTTGLPFATMEWDPPESQAHTLRLPSFQFRRMLREYDSLIGRATALAVTSEGMAERYQRRFGRSSIILRQCVDPGSQVLRRSKRDRSEWIFYVGGNIYADREFEIFLSALDLGGWRVHGRPVRLRWVGPGGMVKATKPRMIEFLGWRSFPEPLELASDCDLGYVPYWFDTKRALESECCFPSKMISYIGVGLTPFFHGPANAGPALFLRRFDAGYVCSGQTPEAVLQDLTAALADPIEHASRSTRCLELTAT